MVFFLKSFSENGFKHLGVDASENVVQAAQANGINQYVDFLMIKHR